MTPLVFFIEWSIRSSALILGGGTLLWLLRVKRASARLTAWKVLLAGSLAIPLLNAALPALTFSLPRVKAAAKSGPTPTGIAPKAVFADIARVSKPDVWRAHGPSQLMPRPTPASQDYSWMDAGWLLYAMVSGVLLVRVSIAVAIGNRLLHWSRPTGEKTDGVQIRESDRIEAPVTLGILRPAIVLPADWKEWDRDKLAAVLAHECSHVRRRDPAIQSISAIHRALLWISPAAWFLHRRIVQTAEEASDDAAVEAACNRTKYAEVLLEFMGRGLRVGVSMARYGSPERRIERILQTSTGRGEWSRLNAVACVTGALVLTCLIATAQTKQHFDAAAVRASVRDPGSSGRLIQLDGGKLLDGRYDVRRASLLDLIAEAYGVAPDQVAGGPSWLEWNRFDIAAQVPANTQPAALPEMLQALLEERFDVQVHWDSRPLPVYVLSRGSGGHKLKPSDGSEQPSCQVAYDNDGLSCRNTTMEGFAARLAAGRSTRFRVLNSTGIEGAWNFVIDYSRPGPRRGMFGIPPPGDIDRGIFDAIDKQLGLKLEQRNVPQPVLVVDRAELPGPDSPEVTERLPPAPMEFEVATIKPCKGFDPMEARATSGVLLNTGCFSLEMLIWQAWDFSTQVQFGPMSVRAYNGKDRMVGPGWLRSRYFEIAARSPIPVGGAQDPNYLVMMRNLLTDRFGIRLHYEDRPRDVQVLTADQPKLERANPTSRTHCDPGSVGTRGTRTVTVITCQNLTMAQFADQLGSSLDFGPVVDETGLEGGYNFRVSYMIAAGARTEPAPEGVDVAVPVAVEPVGGVTLREAIEQQLGLRVENRRRPWPFMVIDRIEEIPAQN